MGLFKGLFKKSGLSDRDAYLGVVLAAIAADGCITDAESLAMVEALSRRKVFDSSEDLDSSLHTMMKILKEKGVHGLVETCAPLLSSIQKASAFAVCCDLVLVEAEHAAEEKKLMETLRKELGVDQALADKITEVMTIKNLS